MKLRKALLAGLVLSAACAPPPETASMVIHGVTVIDPGSEQVLENHSVAVTGDRIVGIEPSSNRGSFAAPDSIDGAGRFLVPGLMDMHVHLSGDDEVAGSTLDLLLAHGITGFREMAADCLDETVDGRVCPATLRDVAIDAALGGRPTPRPLALASVPVNGASQRDNLPDGAPSFLAPRTEADGRELADWMADREIDLVKVYNTVPREAYFGLADRANEIGLEVSGHLPLGVSVLEASAAGQRTIEHARDLPVACSEYRETYRALMERVVAEEEGVDAPSAEARISATLEGFDEALCADVLSTLARNGTYLVPTHGTREMDFRASDDAYRSDERMKYIPAPIRSRWYQDLDRTAEASAELVALFGEFYELGVRLSGTADAAGVRLMAGTDANDTMIFPGFALHDELARFAGAGIEEMDVLKSATSTPAEYLGRSGDLGTISVGAIADLVLLGADPLDQIRNTESIEAVVLGGRIHDRAALDALLTGVEEKAAESARR